MKYVRKAPALQVLDVSGNIGVNRKMKKELARLLGIRADEGVEMQEHERKHQIQKITETIGRKRKHSERRAGTDVTPDTIAKSILAQQSREVLQQRNYRKAANMEIHDRIVYQRVLGHPHELPHLLKWKELASNPI